MMDNKVLLIILAIIISPVAVFIKEGLGKHFWLNIVLVILFVIPGILHALWLVTRKG
ncbi:YqaE/Pmp3 family membrane protein [Shewanella gelidii]|uniref:Proteolipid membrane potential modulator n=1 Tax=Shewanella gelidii TaxID=1642821 RepID=A0A917NDF9_9GAMM|nr:YqaE/Pmp3 family membrane protein [Shewanella gelidii]MCL1098886.1 YqaE/Pmp3 family membrane protein [Shewanella gelidii]GGI89723.1 proteolipid membrane potential modulator [Shewanella gelidii]